MNVKIKALNSNIDKAYCFQFCCPLTTLPPHFTNRFSTARRKPRSETGSLMAQVAILPMGQDTTTQSATSRNTYSMAAFSYSFSVFRMTQTR